MSYHPKIIMITGATSGFGFATAQLFATQHPNCKIIATGRRTEKLEELKNSLSVPVHIISQDIRDLGAVKDDIETLPKEFKDIDLLINNAGLALGAEPFQNQKSDDFMQMIDTNIKGLIATTHAVLPTMINNKNGHIINIGSIAGNYAYPGGHVYCGSKAFVNHFSLALRADLKGDNVRVTAVEPGAVETEFSVVRFKGDKQKADSVYDGYRKLTAEHIAKTLVWLGTQPPEFNVNSIEIMPTDQSFNGFSFDKIR